MSNGNTDSEHVDDQVNQLLIEAEEQLASLNGDDEIDREAKEGFGELAERANELISETSPMVLMEAVDGIDGSKKEPETLTQAIAQSDPETVVSLRKLLTISKMGDAQDSNTFGGHIEKLRDLHDVAEAGQNGGTEDDSRETTASEGEASGDGSAAGEESDYSERITGKIQDGIDEFREGMRTTRAALEGDDETDREGDDCDSTASQTGDGTMFRTVPSRNRADMRVSTGFSTVRNERNNSRD